MFALSESFSMSGYRKRSGTFAVLQLILLILFVFGRPAEARTSIYVFVPGQSTLVQTGGIAGVHETYGIEGKFRLTVDFDAGIASFEQVDANLTEPTGFLYSQGLGEIFNMAGLAGTIVDETTIEFEGKTADGTDSDVNLTLTFEDDSAQLTGKITPPSNSADMFLYELDAVATKKYAGGTGEPNNPYQIATAEDLIAFGETPEDYNKHFILTADINLDPNLPGGRVFTHAVIAPDTNEVDDFQGTAFTGILNGNGHKIKNLTIYGATAEYLGLFGYVGPAGQIHDLGLDDVSINGSACVGALVGGSYGTITNCYATGNVTGGKSSGWLGGLVGRNYGNIKDSNVGTDLTGGDNSWMLGGMAGWHGGSIVNCHATGNISGGNENHYNGGLVGLCSWGTIEDSYSTGNVSGGDENWCLGGLVGSHNSRSVIKNCFAIGNVTGARGSHSLGGLMGSIEYSKVTNCYASGGITIEDSGRDLGGLVGSCNSGLITDCYATGSISGNWALGGLVGNLLIGSKITNCYAVGRVSSITNSANSGGLVGSIGREYIWINDCFWDVETSGLSRSAAGTGLTTAQMQDVGTYQNAGWDYAGYRTDGTSDIWRMPEGGGYPELTIFSEGYQPHILAGTGTPEDPYQIATAEDLGALCQYDRSRNYKLMNDIDLAGIKWATAPIPDFDGSFDGNGHKIKNLTIQGGTKDSHLGLFGNIQSGAWIQNLGLENVLITAGNESFDIGGLAGSNSGNIICCYATGNISVEEESSDIGGLVGFTNTTGDITYCYTTCNISHGYNTERIGGLVGNNYGKITQCFSSGLMVSEGDSIELGGLVGSSAYPDYFINSCFWDVEKSGLSESDGGTGLTTAQIQDPNILMDAGWDFVHESDGPSDIWAQPIGEGYPILSWQLPESQWPQLPSFSGGTGEPNDPYLISTPQELNSIGHNSRLMSAHFKLIEDIDLADVKFFIIGNEIFRFSGIFDGNGHTISNFNYTSTNTNHAGFFGYIDGLYAEVKNLGLSDPNVVAVTEAYSSSIGSLIGRLENGVISGCYVQDGSISGSGHNIAGGLVGVSYGIITDCSVTCSVSGTVGVGGLAGGSHGIIADCKSSGEVSGNDCVGGLLGNAGGIITKCTSSGNVSGNDSIGGLIGVNSGEVTYCYSSADVLSSGSEAGGLVGDNTGTITDSYAAGNTSGNSIVGGLVGSNGYIQEWDLYREYPGYISNCYSTGSVSGTSTVGGLLGHNVVGSVMSSFWDKESSGQLDMCGIQYPDASGCDNANGKTTAEMQMENTFTSIGWDFVDETENGTEDIWWILEGQDYPWLWWELNDGESAETDGNLPAGQ